MFCFFAGRYKAIMSPWDILSLTLSSILHLTHYDGKREIWKIYVHHLFIDSLSLSHTTANADD